MWAGGLVLIEIRVRVRVPLIESAFMMDFGASSKAVTFLIENHVTFACKLGSASICEWTDRAIYRRTKAHVQHIYKSILMFNDML